MPPKGTKRGSAPEKSKTNEEPKPHVGSTSTSATPMPQPEPPASIAGFGQKPPSSTQGPPAKRFNFWETAKQRRSNAVTVTTLSGLNLGQMILDIPVRVSRAGPICISGSGTKYFPFRFTDATGSVQGVAFGSVAEQVFEFIKINCTVKISQGTIQKSKLDNGKYEIVINQANWVKTCEDDVKIPRLEFFPVNISEAVVAPENTILDLLGILVRIDEISTGVGSSGKPYKRRSIHISDSSEEEAVEVTLWGQAAEFIQIQMFQPIAILQGKVQHYKGDMTVKTEFSSGVWVLPEIAEAERLKRWFDGKCNDLDTIMEE